VLVTVTSTTSTTSAKSTVSSALLGAVRWRLIGYVVAIAATTVAGLLTPALVADAANTAIAGGEILGVTVFLAAVLLGGATAEIAAALLGAACAAQGTLRLRNRLARHLLDLGTVREAGAGDTVSRLVYASSEAANAPVAVAGGLVSITGALAGLVLLWTIDPVVGLAFTVLMPLAVLVSRRFLQQVTDVQGRYLTTQSLIADRLIGALTGIRTIRSAGTVQDESRRILAPLGDLSATGRELWSVQRAMMWRLRLVVPACEVAVLAVGGWKVATGRLDAGALLAILGYMTIALAGFDQIDTVLGLGQARAAVKRLADGLKQRPIAFGDGATPAGPGRVEFRHVSLTRAEHPVLVDVTLDIPAGSSVAVVGRSGAGKSALVHLLGRLADPGDGTVLLDGVAVDALRRKDLRAAVTYAFEAPDLFGKTVLDTIRCGADMPIEQVVAAAVAADADGFIRRLPDGYATTLAEAPMSGGELQRIGLARAFARAARVYVLDDATSGLDRATQERVRRAIATAWSGRTRLVVAHHVRTAEECDLVAWLVDGRLRACAPHRELWADAEYRALFGADSDDGEQAS